MDQVVGCFVDAEWLQVRSNGEPLIECRQFRPIECFQDGGMGREHDLNRLAAISIQVAEQPQFLKEIGTQMLCFVENEDGSFAPLIVLGGGVNKEQAKFLFR